MLTIKQLVRDSGLICLASCQISLNGVGYARSTRGSNWTELSYRTDTITVSFIYLPWPLIMLNSRIFIQNSKSCLKWHNYFPHVAIRIKKRVAEICLEMLGGTKYLIFFTFYNVTWFLQFAIFLWIFSAVQWEKLPDSDFNAFPLTCVWHESKVFPACWILIGGLKLQAHNPYARLSLV